LANDFIVAVNKTLFTNFGYSDCPRLAMRPSQRLRLRMKLHTTFAAVAAIFSLVTGAMAAEPVIAKLQVSAPSATKPIAGGAVFECLGDMCASRAPSSDTGSIRACKELARQMGGVNTFGAASKPLNPGELATCNQSARK
jgi:hypothetical protein